jgi:hypothetical protein
MITGAQIRQARKLVGWSVKDARAEPASPITARRYREAGKPAYVPVKAHDACDTDRGAVLGEAKAADPAKFSCGSNHARWPVV